jgi:addiction module HigA family antidote
VKCQATIESGDISNQGTLAMAIMHNPPHPGETLREDVLPALHLTVAQASAQLGVTRAVLSRVLNGRAAISPEMALRIEGWLGVENGGSAYMWIAQQAAYDLWKAQEVGESIRKNIGHIK